MDEIPMKREHQRELNLKCALIKWILSLELNLKMDGENRNGMIWWRNIEIEYETFVSYGHTENPSSWTRIIHLFSFSVFVPKWEQQVLKEKKEKTVDIRRRDSVPHRFQRRFRFVSLEHSVCFVFRCSFCVEPIEHVLVSVTVLFIYWSNATSLELSVAFVLWSFALLEQSIKNAGNTTRTIELDIVDRSSPCWLPLYAVHFPHTLSLRFLHEKRKYYIYVDPFDSEKRDASRGKTGNRHIVCMLRLCFIIYQIRIFMTERTVLFKWIGSISIFSTS